MAVKRKSKQSRKLSWIEVESSQIESVAWDSDTLFIRFHGGNVYSYEDVEEEEYKALLNAESVGKHFSKYIKGEKTCKKI